MIRRRRVHRAIRAAALSAVLVGGAACGSADPPPPTPLPSTRDSEANRLAELVNEHRLEIGCPALAWNDRAAGAATAHSADMYERRFFDHINPEGESPFDRLTAAGVDWSRAAENISHGFDTAESALDSWLRSPEHRANIENCVYTQHGVGVVRNHWTHVFVRP